MKFDAEDLLDGLEGLLKAKLNAQIKLVEGEKANKGKAIGLSEIHPEAYFQQGLSREIINRSPIIHLGIAEITTIASSGATAEALKIYIEVVILDSGMDLNTFKRVHRYTRAIREVVEKNYSLFPVAGKIKIETVEPSAFRLAEDTSENIKVGGVLVSAAIV